VELSAGLAKRNTDWNTYMRTHPSPPPGEPEELFHEQLDNLLGLVVHRFQENKAAIGRPEPRR